jgi:hypothetical protein
MLGSLNYTFASRDAGMIILNTEDDFINSISLFEIGLRMKTKDLITKKGFKDFLVNNVIDWEKDEIRKIEYAVHKIKELLLDLGIKLSEDIVFIKTTGNEEENKGYTRQNAIILPVMKLNNYTQEAFVSFIAHEIFHIISRKHQSVRKELYNLIGFNVIEDIGFPVELANVKITNPDAPLNNCYVNCKANGSTIMATPVLVLNDSKFDFNVGISYLKKCVELYVEIEKEQGEFKYKRINNRIIAYNRSEITDLFMKIGGNKAGLTHPEEILAENFARLVTNVKNIENEESEEIIKKMHEILANKVLSNKH